MATHQPLLHLSSSQSSLSQFSKDNVDNDDKDLDSMSSLAHLQVDDQISVRCARYQLLSSMLQYILCCPAMLGRAVLRCTAFLLPSFIRGWNKVDSTPLPLEPGGQALSALNGLRGVACLIVFNYHLLFVWTDRVDLSWGTVDSAATDTPDQSTTEGDNPHHFLVQLPLIRLLYAGHSMVIVFFVISGYVLSHKPIKLLRAAKSHELTTVLSSSVFRRGIRLFGPSLVGTFITMCFTSRGYFEAGKGVRTDPDVYRGVNEEHPVRLDTFYEQMVDWRSSMTVLVGNVWNWNLYYNNYDPHLWTIPLEFRSSIILFICLLAFSRLRPLARLILTSFLLVYSLLMLARWEVFLFLSGMMLAELDIISGIFDQSPLLGEKDPGQDRRSYGWAWSVTMLIGLFLSSCPSHRPEDAPGYMLLTSYLPPGYSWQPGRPFQAVGGCLIVWSFMHLPRVQRVFTTSIAQYLGRISFAFYIVHGPILHAFGYRFVLHCWTLTGDKAPFGFASGLCLASLVILPLAIWAADLFWRAVDTPFVRFARWIEMKLLVESISRRAAIT